MHHKKIMGRRKKKESNPNETRGPLGTHGMLAWQAKAAGQATLVPAGHSATGAGTIMGVVAQPAAAPGGQVASTSDVTAGSEFLKRWTDACVEMSAGRREDLGIGILTTASCDRFLDSYKSLLDRKASYAEIRSNDEALRKKLRAGSRMRHQPAKAQHDRGCAQCHNRPG